MDRPDWLEHQNNQSLHSLILIRTLLWEAGDSDKFVGADLSTETNWKHQTVKLPVQSVESQVCKKKQPREYDVYTKALQKHYDLGIDCFVKVAEETTAV